MIGAHCKYMAALINDQIILFNLINETEHLRVTIGDEHKYSFSYYGIVI